MSIRRGIVVVLLGFLATACFATPEGKAKSESSRLCVANQTLVCTCGLDRGTQICDKDQVLSECDCSPAGAARKPGPTKEDQGGSDSDLKDKTSSKTPQGSDDNTEPDTEPDHDAGVTPGPTCRGLMTCCDNLRAAGITGSASQCDRISLGGEEYACQLAHDEYKKPDDYYDPVCF